MKPCAVGSTRNSETNRCRKDCKDTEERNEKGRCVKSKQKKTAKEADRDSKKQEEHKVIGKKIDAPKVPRRKKVVRKKSIPRPIPSPFPTVAPEPVRAEPIVDKKQERIQRKKPVNKGKQKKPVQKQNIVRKGRVAPLFPTVQPSVRARILEYDQYKGPVCNITDDEAKSLSDAFTIKYDNRYDSCKFISGVLKLPRGTILTNIISNGSFGIVINAETRSGKSYIAKVAFISRKDMEINIKRENKTISWNSVTEQAFMNEVKSQSIVHDLYKNENLMGDIKGAHIPAIKDHYVVKTGGRTFGVILMEKVKGVPLGNLMATATRDNFDRVLKLFYKFASVIGRLHYEGVIHGDPHVWNVLVLDGTDDLAIIDFGETVLYEERLGEYDLLSRGDTRFEIHGPSYTTINRKYDQLQVLAFFLFFKDSYFSLRLSGGLGILEKLHELFNPGTIRVITEVVYGDVINGVYQVFDPHVYTTEDTFTSVKLDRIYMNFYNRSSLFRDSRDVREREKPGGIGYHETYDRKWTMRDELIDLNRDMLEDSVLYYRPPDTTRIVFFKR